ncbi:glycosyltransferase family 1 protein [Marinobacter sp. S6332]|uniref:glycosyltransferase family 4 protein n=1 Tax=Marinobacter sp. S6332 TaxID=2926403 RepID=UPI001FF1C26C|nr:glycosyltransferase family 1 protein [Marinobacter sp. S6332]MCK0163738.1 glycosyltransferase family 4 protein [Marinobacter sp. S6332]
MLRLDSLEHPRTGIGYYTEHLCRELLREQKEGVAGVFRGQLLQGNSLYKVLNEEDVPAAPDAFSSTGGITTRALRRCKPLLRALPGAYPLRQALRDWRSQGAASAFGHCVYHEPNFIPFQFSGPLVLTVHDLSHERFPQYHPASRVRFLSRRLPAALERADVIVTDSQFTKDEIASFFPAVASKIVPIHLGVDSTIRELGRVAASEVLARYSLDYKGYILSVATLEPRKNLVGLIRAYDRLPKRIKADLPLVLVGGEGWSSQALYRLIGPVRSRGGYVILTGRVPRSDLAGLLSGARLFAYPSFYEGFGLPIAEARACGTPVLTSGFGAMAEVAGDQAFLADLENLAESLEAALSSMPQRLSPVRYSWDETARKTLSVYRSLQH